MNGDADLSLLEMFRDEVRTQAATLRDGLGHVPDAHRLEELILSAHAIRSAARIVGLHAAAELGQALAERFSKAREDPASLGRAVPGPVQDAVDLLTGLGEIPGEQAAAWLADRQPALRDLCQQIVQDDPPGDDDAAATAEAVAQTGPVASVAGAPVVDLSLLELFREEVRSHTTTLSNGLLQLESDAANPQRIEPLMRAAHSLKGAARILGVEAAVQLAHVLEDALIAAQHGRIQIGADDIDVFLRATDALASLESIEASQLSRWGTDRRVELDELKEHLRAISQGQGSVAKPTVQSLDQPAAPPTRAVPATASPPSGPEAHEEQVPVQAGGKPVGNEPTPSAAPAAPLEAVVRVTAQSLNRLMGLAGESLVQARWLQPFATSLQKLKKHQDHLALLLENLIQALPANGPDDLSRLICEARRQAVRAQQVLGERISEFEDHAAQAEDLNSRLYREVILSRMRPFSDGTHGFPRMVRDLARRLEKQVRLEILGSATAVDRDILEKLEAPLTHLLRNAVDHGIESPAQRRAAGKSETGLLRLEARHRAGMLVITVSDDGAGVDVEQLRKKVVERGLVTAEMAAALKEAELLEFLFLPGFSTAKAVTEFSGRGVGLDVVQDMVRQVGGSVHLTSRLGQGTRFVLQLPITLSVLRAVLVDIAGEPYAFPHNRIDRLLRVPRSSIRSLEDRQFITVDDQNVGLVLAAQLFDLPPIPPPGEDLPVVLLGDASGLYGLIVNDFKGEQDLVVRPLDPRLGKVPNVSAAALLDDGAPVLIADLEDLLRATDRLIQTEGLQRCERPEPDRSSRRKRVLVVEDSITVREVERQLLRSRGYEVSVAVDGKEGWNRLQAEPFDLLVSDVDMPRMTGLELVKAVRADRRLQDLPVIIISYKDREEDRLRGLEVGANYYLTKSSFHDDTFLRAVTDLIGEA